MEWTMDGMDTNLNFNGWNGKKKETEPDLILSMEMPSQALGSSFPSTALASGPSIKRNPAKIKANPTNMSW